jgi:hypothetical protein
MLIRALKRYATQYSRLDFVIADCEVRIARRGG